MQRLQQTQHRNTLLARAHLLAKELDMDEMSYRAVLQCHTGKRSCKDLSHAALFGFIKALERMATGLGPDDPTGMSITSSMALPVAVQPTLKQWETLTGLSRAMGWRGLRDERFLSFVRRTAKASRLEELTRHEASACITGLLAWQKQVKHHHVASIGEQA